MDNGLSLAVQLGNLNDFLEPSQDCAVDLERPNLLKKSGNEKTQISLTDCLACSGCVTTAETVLLTSHNHELLLEKLTDPGDKRVVISLSAVSEAVLMAYCGVSTRAELYGILKSTLPTTCAAIYSCDFAEELLNCQLPTGKSVSSHCPGVPLYVEKFEHGVLQNLVTTPPAQIWQGAVVKYLASHHSERFDLGVVPWLDWGTSPESIYHVTVNTCADKKLESVRPEFAGLIDLSLSTDEFATVLNHYGLQRSAEPSCAGNWDLCHILRKAYGCAPRARKYHLTRANGWFAANVLEAVPSLEPSKGINNDHVKYGNMVAVASGLRNMKNLMNKILPSDQQLIEVLACPQGCFNGPGQSRVYSEVTDCKRQAKLLYSSVLRWTPLDPQAALHTISQRRPDLQYNYRVVESQPSPSSRMNW